MDWQSTFTYTLAELSQANSSQLSSLDIFSAIYSIQRTTEEEIKTTQQNNPCFLQWPNFDGICPRVLRGICS